MGQRSGMGSLGPQPATALSLDDAATVFPMNQTAAMGVLNRHSPFQLTQRAACVGPLTVMDLSTAADMWLHCEGDRAFYEVELPIAGQVDIVHRTSVTAAHIGHGALCLPEGEVSVPRWTAGSRVIMLRIDRGVLEDALSQAVGRQITSQIAFKPSISASNSAARSWMRMLFMIAKELLDPNSLLSQPMIAAPLTDAFIQALLMAADHPDRGFIAADAQCLAPQHIRAAIDIIEAEPGLPLTISSLAARCHVSVRALQQGFGRHLGVSPMTYLRQVRLRHARQDLLERDPSVETVASVARRWGFAHPGRFSAAYSARYGETPATTLRHAISHPPTRRLDL